MCSSVEHLFRHERKFPGAGADIDVYLFLVGAVSRKTIYRAVHEALCDDVVETAGYYGETE
jgi:hypothetical protein